MCHFIVTVKVHPCSFWKTFKKCKAIVRKHPLWNLDTNASAPPTPPPTPNPHLVNHSLWEARVGDLYLKRFYWGLVRNHCFIYFYESLYHFLVVSQFFLIFNCSLFSTDSFDFPPKVGFGFFLFGYKNSRHFL